MGVVQHRCFRCGRLRAARALIGLCTYPWLWACAPGQPALIQVCTHPSFQVWAPRPLIEVRTHPGALGLCAQAARLLIWVLTNWASGVCWGCLSGLHSLGAEGVGVQEAMATAESSLNSC